jgi:hypothetical protein
LGSSVFRLIIVIVIFVSTSGPLLQPRLFFHHNILSFSRLSLLLRFFICLLRRASSFTRLFSFTRASSFARLQLPSPLPSFCLQPRLFCSRISFPVLFIRIFRPDRLFILMVHVH